jgi:hypothetical protein
MHVPEIWEPNTTRTENWNWDQAGNMVFVGFDHEPPYYYETIAAGKYNVVGLFQSHTLNMLIKTPPVAFTIQG